MPRIVIGVGSVQTLLEVPQKPNVGDRITVREDQVLAVATGNACFLVGDTFVLTTEGTIEVEGEQVPAFSIRNARYPE